MEYPNKWHINRNGKWKCVERYKCIKNTDGKHKTVCVRVENAKEGEEMASIPTDEEIGAHVAEVALDEYKVNGRTVREWVELISRELSIVELIHDQIFDRAEMVMRDFDGSAYETGKITGFMLALEVVKQYREKERIS
jgi:enolase